jgi:hypothetical protein
VLERVSVPISKEVSMHPMACGARMRAMSLSLSILCGVTLATSTQAQPPDFSFPTAAPNSQSNDQQQQQSAGILLTVPMADYGQIAAQNGIKQKNVNLLQLTQVAIGGVNTQVATISIRQKNKKDKKKWEPSKVCYLPMRSLEWIRQANKNTAILNQAVYGSGNQQVAQVEVYQDNDTKVKKGAKFMMAPKWAADSILALNQTNVNLVHISQLAVGNDNSQVAVFSVDQQNAGQVKVPSAAAGAMVQLNLNLTIINQIAIGDGNTQVATVSIGQGNGL